MQYKVQFCVGVWPHRTQGSEETGTKDAGDEKTKKQEQQQKYILTSNFVDHNIIVPLKHVSV